MVEGAGFIIGVTLCVVVALIAFCCWLDRKAQPLDIYEPIGDATDTTEMRSNVRRANQKGRA